MSTPGTGGLQFLNSPPSFQSAAKSEGLATSQSGDIKNSFASGDFITGGGSKTPTSVILGIGAIILVFILINNKSWKSTRTRGRGTRK